MHGQHDREVPYQKVDTPDHPRTLQGAGPHAPVLGTEGRACGYHAEDSVGAAQGAGGRGRDHKTGRCHHVSGTERVHVNEERA